MSEIKLASANPDRRKVMLAGTALFGAAAWPGTVFGAAESGLASAAELLGSVRKFLSGLEPDKRKAASFSWTGRSGAAGIILASVALLSQACGLSR